MSHRNYPLRVARLAFGIRAQDLRTLVRKAWWARRWIAAVEALRLGPRLGRGRQYAVSGQVVELAAVGPHVTAKVLGSRPEPYVVALDFTTPSEAARARIAAKLQASPILLARLFTDDLPTEVEAIFRAEGCPLFPVAGVKPPYDVKMSCNCPDWAKPCKHVAAVLFLLGEEIARRPAALLALRGIDLEADYPVPTGDRPLRLGDALPATAVLKAEELSNDPAALVRRLGSVPFWRGVDRCTETLSRMMTRMSAVAADIAR